MPASYPAALMAANVANRVSLTLNWFSPVPARCAKACGASANVSANVNNATKLADRRGNKTFKLRRFLISTVYLT